MNKSSSYPEIYIHKLSVNASKTNYMILGTSHITNKYIDVNEYCHDDDIKSTISIAFHNKEKVAKQRSM